MSLRDIKDSVVKELDWKLKNEILEQTNYDLLVKLINRAEDEKEVSAIFQLGTQYYKTGLKYDVRLEKTSPDIHYLKKNEEKSFETDSNALTHKLIIGDNYYALLNLLVSHRGLIDVIYIDPPYGCDSMGQFADTNYDNHITRDNLLSMLHTRLILAKQLLSKTGVIFCSIDDRNQAYVKCLFDNVFGEENFIACIPRKTGAGDAATHADAQLRKPFDYTLLYKRSGYCKLKKIEKGEKEYPHSDYLGNYKLDQFQASGSDATKSARPNLYYPIYVSKDNKLSIYQKNDDDIIILPKIVNGEDGRWMWKPEKFEKDNEKFIFYDKNNNKIYRKTYFDGSKDQTIYQVEQAWLDNSKYRNAEGTKELDSIMNSIKKVFDNPKPVDFIKWCVNIMPNQDSIVLDFFAGSGTTGQAVLDLNKEDGGNRKFILCTNNDTDEININGIAYDVTCERLKRVMTGKDYNEENNFKWAEKNEPYGDNLLVCECETINNFTQTPGNNAFEKIDETLYDQKKMNDPDKIKWVCENFNLTCKYIEGEE